MPYECLRCGNLDVEESSSTDGENAAEADSQIQARVCSKCGSTDVRYSLLAGLVVQEEVRETVETKKSKNRSMQWADRIHQFVVGLVVYHLLGALFAALVVAAFLAKGMPPRLVPDQSPLLFAVACYAVPLAAVIVTTILVFRDVYLGQIVACLVGLAGCAAVLGERLVFNIPPVLVDWVVQPFCGGLLGFTFGLLVAGRFRDEDESEAVRYKPIDAWDKKAKPKYRELESHDFRFRWRTMIAGFVVGFVLPAVAHIFIATVMRSISMGPALAESRANQIDPIMKNVAYGIAAIIAGSGTKFGSMQGLICTLAVFFALQRTFHTTVDSSAFIMEMSIAAVIGCLGGMVGRTIFPPHRVYTGKHEDQRSRPPRSVSTPSS